MITLLHGENTTASRKKLEEIKAGFTGEIVVLDGKTVTETEFVQATQSQSMFDQKRLVVVEGIPSFEIKNLEEEVVFWENKKIANSESLKSLKSLKVEEFKTPAIIFKLTDSLRPGNGKGAVRVFRECLVTLDAEYIFLMIVWAYRQKKDKDKLAELLKIDYQHKQGLLIKDLPLALELFFLSL